MTEGFFVGPFFMRWGGFFLGMGIVAGFYFSQTRSRCNEAGQKVLWAILLPLVSWGVIGARLWHILTPPLSSVQLGLTTYYYLTHPLDILSLWTGGFGIPGAFLGGAIALYFYARRTGIHFWGLADLLAPGLALSQSIGRLGNYFNQELYGLPTDLPWGILIDPANRLAGYQNIHFYHPLFVYESIAVFLLFLALLWISKVPFVMKNDGNIFLIYFCGYAVVRFLLEFLRLDIALVHGWNINQLFFATGMAISFVELMRRRTRSGI